MLNKLKQMADTAKNALSTAVVHVGDLNGDGKVDEEDARIAAEWAKKTASSAGDEAARLGMAVVRSDLVRDVAAGAAVGAAVGMVAPIPFVGSSVGATVGAGMGVYKNLTRGGQSATPLIEAKSGVDVHAALLKLEDLRQKNIITQAEFDSQKKKILQE